MGGAPWDPVSVAGGVIGGQAFYDTDNDGTRDENVHVAHGVPGINVWLFSCDPPHPASLAHFRTLSNGIFRFVNLPIRTYYVVVQPPTEY